MNSPHEKHAELFATDQRLKTGYGNNSRTQDFYLFLQGDDETHAHAHKKYFNGKTEIFVNALLLGYFHNRGYDQLGKQLVFHHKLDHFSESGWNELTGISFVGENSGRTESTNGVNV